MNEHEEFLSSKHKQLLSIATWAKYLAWSAIVMFTFVSLFEFVKSQYDYSYEFQKQAIFSEILKDQPLLALNTILNAISVLFKGVVYYLVLKGVSLGLNMIVETDINYREQKEHAREL